MPWSSFCDEEGKKASHHIMHLFTQSCSLSVIIFLLKEVLMFEEKEDRET